MFVRRPTGMSFMHRSGVQPIALALFILIAWPLRCGHAADKDGGYVTYPATAASPGPVLFSHAAHGVGGAGFDCNRCHSDRLQAPAITMPDIQQKRVCGACHDGATAGPRNRAVAHPVRDCQRCHMPAQDIAITMNRMNAVPFSHVRHLAVAVDQKSSRSVGLSCGLCHPALFARGHASPIGMEVPHVNGDGCAYCHDGKKRKNAPTAFSADTRCLTCHK